MLSSLKAFFDSVTSPSSAAEPPQRQQHALHLAAAVLLVEVMRAQPDIDPAEYQAVIAALQRKFVLGDSEVTELVEAARAEALKANDFFHFPNRLNDHFTHPQKVALIEAMWQVAYADAHLDAGENHVISKVAGLLHVTHGEYIAAKLRAKEDARL